jgi:hypothetical protein
MFRSINNGVTTIKPGYQTTGNMHVIWSDKSSSLPFPTSGRVYVCWTPKAAYNPECLGSNSETWGKLCDGLGSNSMVQNSVGPIITLHGQITAREYMDRLGNQGASHDPDFISKQQCSFPRWLCSHSHSWNCSVMACKSMKVSFNIFPGQHNHQIWTSLNHLAQIRD